MSRIGFLATPVAMAALADGDGNGGHQARVANGAGDDVFRAEFHLAATVGGGDFLGHFLARERGDGFSGGDFHVLVDLRGAHVERTAEDIGGSP